VGGLARPGAHGPRDHGAVAQGNRRGGAGRCLPRPRRPPIVPFSPK
jgi:hypothetical protein